MDNKTKSKILLKTLEIMFDEQKELWRCYCKSTNKVSELLDESFELKKQIRNLKSKLNKEDK